MPDGSELPPVLQAFGVQLASAMRAAEGAATAGDKAGGAGARGRAARLAAGALRAPRRWVVLTVTAGVAASATAAVLATLLLSAGAAAPAPAQAFPILADRASEIGTSQLRGALRGVMVLVAAQELGLGAPTCRPSRASCASQQHAILMVRSWLRGLLDGDQHAADAHQFDAPGGTGFVIASPDRSVLCLQYLTSGATWSLAGACSATAQAEHQGLLLTPQSLIAPQPRTHAFAAQLPSFIALVPVGATVSLTEHGATRTLLTHEGIATGVVDVAATVSLHVAGSTSSVHLAPPQAQPTIGGVPATPGSLPPRGVTEFSLTPGMLGAWRCGRARRHDARRSGQLAGGVDRAGHSSA